MLPSVPSVVTARARARARSLMKARVREKLIVVNVCLRGYAKLKLVD
jgi:hypothetical protein